MRNQQYAGSDWIRQAITPNLSPLGKAVADFLGDVFRGIYHLNSRSLRKVAWDDPTYIEVTIGEPLATIDNNLLTRIVVLAHHRLLRVSIEGVAPRYLRLAFHQRTTRNGRLYERCPLLSDHIRQIESHYRLEDDDLGSTKKINSQKVKATPRK